MKLKALLQSLEGLDEAYHDLYEKTDEGFVFTGVDDTDFKGKLSEFRDNNRKLFKKKGELEAQLEGLKDLDPEKYHEGLKALEELQKRQDLKDLDEGKVEEVVARRTEAMRLDYETRLKKKNEALEAAQQQTSSLTSRLGGLLIDKDVLEAVGGVGRLRSEKARQDILNRAHSVWKINDSGEVVPMKGSEIVYGKNGDPLTMKEWAANQLEEADHLFISSEGGGGGGNDTPHQKKTKRIPNNPIDIGKNLEKIAKGEASVGMGG